jgi:hypothetical protein
MLANEHGEKRKAEIDRGAAGASRKRSRTTARGQTRGAILDAAIAEFAERIRRGEHSADCGSAWSATPSLPTTEARTFSGDGCRACVRTDQGRVDTLAPENRFAAAPLREEYATLFPHRHPEFHRFMRQEAFTNNPRLKWVAETGARRRCSGD